LDLEDWIYLAQDKDLQLELMNKVTNRRISQKAVNFFTYKRSVCLLHLT